MSGDLTETLPARVSPDDLVEAKADLATHGFCLLDGALTPERAAKLRSRIMELAEQEVADGTDYGYEGGANQRVWSLLRKDDMSLDLAAERVVMRLMEHLRAFSCVLSHIDANNAVP